MGGSRGSGEGSGAGAAPEEAPTGADASGRRHPLAPRSNTVHARPSREGEDTEGVLAGVQPLQSWSALQWEGCRCQRVSS